MIDEADCVLVGGASGLSAAGGGDFYYEDNATYRRHFGQVRRALWLQGCFRGFILSLAYRRGALGLSCHLPRHHAQRPAAQALQGPRRHPCSEGLLCAHH